MKPARKPHSALGLGFPSKRLLAWICALIFVLTTLPLYVISLYNHPYYDDYKFSADVHAVWRETGSVPQLIQAAFASARYVRDTWQGTYTGTILSNVQPGVFGLYFLTTFLLLTAFLLCFGFFLRMVFGELLGLGKAEPVILISLTLTLLVQFMPDPDEAFFWFNGGIGNTFIYSLLALSLGLCVRLERGSGRGRAAALIAALAALMVLLGGGSYGGGVFGLLVYALVTVFGFARKSRYRFVYLALEALFLGCFLYSMAAPGNAIRAAMIGASVSPAWAVLQALRYGIAVGGSYIRLPLVGVTLCALPFFIKAAERSPYAFRHPWLALFGGVCLYSAQFAPPLYSGVFIGGPRIIDTYYQSFVILWLLYAFYLTGFFLRRMEKRPTAPTLTASPRLWQGFAAAGCCLLLVGCLAYKRPQDTTYGPQNMAGGSAALSLLRGEAQAYDREMKAREALLGNEDLPVVTLAPLSAVPDIFMKDLLEGDAPHGVRDSLREYYGKEAILLEGEP